MKKGNKKLNSKRRLMVALSLLSGATSQAAVPASGVNVQRARAILNALGSLQNQTHAKSVLKNRGFSDNQITEILSQLNGVNCEVFLSAESLPRSAQKALDLLLRLTPNEDRLQAIYTAVTNFSGSTTATNVTNVSLDIPNDGIFSRTIKNLDRAYIYETFRQAALNDAKLSKPAIQTKSKLVLKNARFNGWRSRNKIVLDVSVQYPSARRMREVSLEIPFPGGSERPESFVVMALMALAASQHLVEDIAKLRLEINAVLNVAQSLLVAKAFDRASHSSDARIQLQQVVELLSNPGGRSGGRVPIRLSMEQSFGRLILARWYLMTFMERSARDVAASTTRVTTLPRTNMFRAPSDQVPAQMGMVTPNPSGQRAAGQQRRQQAPTSSDTYYTTYYVYDPFIGFYYPWVPFPGYPFGPYYAPFFHAQIIANSADTTPRMQSYEYQASPGYNQSLQTPVPFVGPDQQVIVVPPGDNARLQELRNLEGFQQANSGVVDSTLNFQSTRQDFPTLEDRTRPATADGASTPVVQVTGDAIITTTGSTWQERTGTPDRTESYTPAPVSAPTTTTTTGTESVTTTTTTGWDSTTTTTTGSDSTTTTTTGGGFD